MMLPIILFGLAAIGGLAMAIVRFGGKPAPPLAIAVIHGLAAAIGLVTLIIAVMGAGATKGVTVALVLFLAAALGGFVLLFQHLKGRAISLPLMVVHAAVAVVAFVTLLLNA